MAWVRSEDDCQIPVRSTLCVHTVSCWQRNLGRTLAPNQQLHRGIRLSSPGSADLFLVGISRGDRGIDWVRPLPGLLLH